MVLTATSPKKLPDRWGNLIKSLDPIIGPAMVELTLAQGDGGGFDYWDAVDVATHSGFRAMFTYDMIGGGTNPAEIDLRKMIKKVTAANGVCDAYSCLGPKERYHVRYGVEPTTTEIMSVSRSGTPMAEVWDNLGQVGEDVETLRKIETPYATGVVGDYAAVRSVEKGKEVVYVADSGGLFRGSPPSGKKPKPPTMPPR